MESEKIIGYTTGVFDLFHVGHLNILEKAKQQCDFLIVGVSTDEVVKDYKGKYPVIPFEQRIRIVGALKCVDKVIPQTSMNKMEAWEKLHFGKLFHGDDWKNSKLYQKYEEEFRRVGVEVIYIPHTEGVSTSLIMKRAGKESE